MTRRVPFLAAGLLLLTACGSQGGSGSRSEDPADDGVLRYAALGDSFTSAPGIAPMDQTNGCQRSRANYPARIAEALGAELADASCGSATNDHVEQPQPSVTPQPEPQLAAVTADTDLVTVALGLNDEAFYYDMVIGCPALLLQQGQDPATAPGTPCTDALAATPAGTPADRLPRIRERLAATLADVRDEAPDATVVVVGYPQLVPEQGTCPALPLPPGDLPAFREAFVGLAEVMAEVAKKSGAEFVDVLAASAGHHVCSAEPWVNGAFLADDATPFHPFPAEQQAIADLVVEAYRS